VTSPAPNPPDQHPAGHGPGDEPLLEVPAGLLGQAIELLDICDELLNHPGPDLTDSQVGAVIGRYRHPASEMLRWFHDGLGATAADLQDLLDAAGVIVDLTLRGRPAHHRHHRR
jgi:hypothetical protein